MASNAHDNHGAGGTGIVVTSSNVLLDVKKEKEESDSFEAFLEKALEDVHVS